MGWQFVGKYMRKFYGKVKYLFAELLRLLRSVIAELLRSGVVYRRRIPFERIC